MYVEHADGRTSVYAHLRAFKGEVGVYVKQQQYAHEHFAVDVEAAAGRFPVKKGDIIAYSGNSGSSGGPHLHFEVRETSGQVPVNPLKFGFEVKDDRTPVMERLWIYNHAKDGHVEGMARERMLELEKGPKGYSLKGRAEVKALGTVSVGIAAIDRFTDSENLCGTYRMTVMVDSTVIHRHAIDRAPFETKRQVNAHIDYDKRQRYGDIVYRSYIAPNNALGIYKDISDHGMFHVAEGATYTVRIELEDFNGNRSSLQFEIIGEKWPERPTPPPGDVTDSFLPDHENSFSKDDFRLSIPQGCLYDTLAFRYQRLPVCKDCLSAVHAVHDLRTPLDDFMNLSIRLAGNLEADRSKLLIVSFDAKGRPVAEGGSMTGQWLAVRTRSFGNYAVMQDTTPPVLRPKNFREGQSTALLDTLIVHLGDDLSGIQSYRATLNGSWLLMEHDPKNRVIYYVKDDRFKAEGDLLEITAIDKVGNRSDLRLNCK
ncbi:MAG: M23 family metallopeptidase [Flavobacteriales bacterium]|nr:M23 family metallopeptidase [Flavobacteriales bacterium]